jgi:light-regulated signal transduction histidine kinase (bacteriophytochrome)
MTEDPTYEELQRRVKDLEKQAVKKEEAEKALRLAHRDLSRKAEALKAANEELAQYFHVIAHDLKTPLRAIRNYSDFLCEDLEKILTEDHIKVLDGLEKAVREGEEMAEDLFEFSRVGVWSIPTQKTDIGVFLQGFLAELSLPSDVEVVVENNWPTIETDPYLLEQIFENLINNAIKFNDSVKKRIEIGCLSAGENHYEFFVRDNGIGIDPKYHEQIFVLFQRLHTKLDYPGTGHGLATVKKAVIRLHGSVRVESKPGEGSTFFLKVPKTQRKR